MAYKQAVRGQHYMACEQNANVRGVAAGCVGTRLCDGRGTPRRKVTE